MGSAARRAVHSSAALVTDAFAADKREYALPELENFQIPAEMPMTKRVAGPVRRRHERRHACVWRLKENGKRNGKMGRDPEALVNKINK